MLACYSPLAYLDIAYQHLTSCVWRFLIKSYPSQPFSPTCTATWDPNSTEWRQGVAGPLPLTNVDEASRNQAFRQMCGVEERGQKCQGNVLLLASLKALFPGREKAADILGKVRSGEGFPSSCSRSENPTLPPLSETQGKGMLVLQVFMRALGLFIYLLINLFIHSHET